MFDICKFIWKESVPYPPEESIKQPECMERKLVHDGRTDILPFHLDTSIAVFEGRIYIVWYNSTDAEICGTSLIRGICSPDGGETWSEPFTVAGSIGNVGHHYVPANLFVHDGRLYALITEMSGKNITTSLRLFGRIPGDEEKWEEISQVAEGFITNTPPRKMADGNWIVGGWTPMKNETPAFPVVLISQGGEIAKPWRCRFLYDPLKPGAVRIRCAEITLHETDNVITAYVRNDEGPSWVFESGDFGLRWSPPMRNPMKMTGSKMFAGTLSNGVKYLIYNEERGYFVRTLLVMAAGEPGERAFNRVYRLFDGDEPELGRGKIWFYPVACEWEGHLYVTCTLQEPDNVRTVALAKIPINSI